MTNDNMAGLSPRNIDLEKIRPLPGLEEDKQPDKAYGSLVSSIWSGCRPPSDLPMKNELKITAAFPSERA